MASNSSSRSADDADRPLLNIRDVARAGRLYSLAVDRFPGMPLFPGHPPFQVLTYRSPQGLKISGARPWGPGNDAGLGYMCEYVLSTSHSGAHIDALAHMSGNPKFGVGEPFPRSPAKGPSFSKNRPRRPLASVPSRLVLELAGASSGDMRLSDHAARSMI